MSKDDRAMADGAAIAIYLVGALLFSIITIFAFVVAMSRWLKG
jgi:heme/copper-type cytochrome/quinol oxidase subunit 4